MGLAIQHMCKHIKLMWQINVRVAKKGADGGGWRVGGLKVG